MSDLFRETGATFSACRQYRTRLWRRWAEPGAADRSITFLMLNPSTADDVDNDPTVQRCETRARKLGFTTLYVVNLFALRSTDPGALKPHREPIGLAEGNDAAITAAFLESDAFVLGWGKHGNLGYRGRLVALYLALLATPGAPVLCLGQNGDGSPEHPLYIGYDRPLVRFDVDRYLGGFSWNWRTPPDCRAGSILEALGSTGDLAVTFWDLQKKRRSLV